MASSFFIASVSDDRKLLNIFETDLAYAHALLGDVPLAIGLMEKLIKEQPDRSVGYCGLVDVLTFYCKRIGLKPDYKKAFAVIEEGKRKARDQVQWGFDDVYQSVRAAAKAAGYSVPGKNEQTAST